MTHRRLVPRLSSFWRDSFWRNAQRFWRDERGATAIEYALIATLICVAIVAALTLYAGNVGNMFNNISNTVDSST